MGDGGLDGGEDQLLSRAGLAIGEDQPLGRRVALGGAALLGLPGVEERVDPAADGGGERLEVELERLALGLVAADGDQHQLGAHGGRLGVGEHPGVEERLALIPLAHRRRQRAPPPHRLDLLDHQRPVRLAAQAVGPPLDGHPPAAVLEDVGDHHLATVGGVLGQLLLLIPAMDRLPQPQPLVAAATRKAEAAQKRRFQEIGDGEVELEALGVEARGHPGRVYVSMPPLGAARACRGRPPVAPTTFGLRGWGDPRSPSLSCEPTSGPARRPRRKNSPSDARRRARRPWRAPRGGGRRRGRGPSRSRDGLPPRPRSCRGSGGRRRCRTGRPAGSPRKCWRGSRRCGCRGSPASGGRPLR